MDKRFIINLQGKDFVTFEGLLNLAHEQGLESVTTEVMQIPNAENGDEAIVHAIVKTSLGIFQGTGDASPKTTNRGIAPHRLRMAETRAVARALRFATNVGMTAADEMGGSGGQEESESSDAATEKQMKLLKSLVNHTLLTEDERARFAAFVDGAPSKSDASYAIEKVKALIDARKTFEPTV